MYRAYHMADIRYKILSIAVHVDGIIHSINIWEQNILIIILVCMYPFKNLMSLACLHLQSKHKRTLMWQHTLTLLVLHIMPNHAQPAEEWTLQDLWRYPMVSGIKASEADGAACYTASPPTPCCRIMIGPCPDHCQKRFTTAVWEQNISLVFRDMIQPSCLAIMFWPSQSLSGLYSCPFSTGFY